MCAGRDYISQEPPRRRRKWAGGARGALWARGGGGGGLHHGGFHLGLHVQFRLLLQRQQQRRPRRCLGPPPPGAARRLSGSGARLPPRAAAGPGRAAVAVLPARAAAGRPRPGVAAPLGVGWRGCLRGPAVRRPAPGWERAGGDLQTGWVPLLAGPSPPCALGQGPWGMGGRDAGLPWRVGGRRRAEDAGVKAVGGWVAAALVFRRP